MSDQVVRFVGEYRRRVPHGIFKESDDFSAIIKAIFDLENGMNANAREAQLQSSSQTQLSQSSQTQSVSKRRTSQSILYGEHMKEGCKRLLRRAKECADAAQQVGHGYERTYLRNWLSVINDESGAWLSAGASSIFF